ncbi:helix-turn-helix domain-containing protein [Enterococcus faecalis]|uniref:helix-turn-helix transcriptional regulator n=1 Tax=Enterococcus faecalis TaxID=1351 RepID=UPI0015745365|nr:helix-turn-helix transcriptional regulator [Enterococcus faecalis]MCE2555221.1 helix-turn-helix domain-containing protein [Enterococcus faecalis]NSQ31503.1 helix-turn-helix transcriptional regulator [Enterococcus faecalis]UNQ04626.1 helix-turn-helix transcriptional regulator [Enterococcus faecalis]UNQ07626.1 helix-turn-helix transcriptional regulator [Enterococcus faecalis]HCT5213403.1 helix-turn-helix transcriptional regulator [Enterococcus faecalis]
MKVTLKGLRAMRNWTQREAAEAIGVSVETWANYEKGKTYPDVPVIKSIEKVFDVTYNDIIFSPLNYGLTVKSKRPV